MVVTNLNEQIIEEWSKEQDKSRLTNEILIEWNTMNQTLSHLKNENKDMKMNLISLRNRILK